MRFEEDVAARELYRNIPTQDTPGGALPAYVEAYVKADSTPGSSGILHGCRPLCSSVFGKVLGAAHIVAPDSV